MNIIFNNGDIDLIKSNSVVLELDTFYFPKSNKTVTAYCVIDNIKITDFDKIEQNQNLHATLIDAYKRKDFNLCENLLEHLMGVFDGEIDSFYQDLLKRTADVKSKTSNEDWTPTIIRED
jgi:hypothetical protein